MMERMRLRLVGVTLFAVAGFAQEKESALGRGLAEEMKRGARPVDDQVLQTYLVSLAARLNHFAQIQFPLTIEVAAFGDTSRRDLAAFPGGYIIVPLKLLQTAQDEAELIKTLAHGLAHIAKRHGMKQYNGGPVVFLGGRDGFHPGRRPDDESEADSLATQWAAQVPGSGEFTSMQARALALTPPARRPPPTLRRN